MIFQMTVDAQYARTKVVDVLPLPEHTSATIDADGTVTVVIGADAAERNEANPILVTLRKG